MLEAGSSMEEVRFCVAPEALLVKLVMESLEPNEVIIVTVSGVQSVFHLEGKDQFPPPNIHAK